MKNGTVTELDVTVNIPLLFKVNKETREVEGIATQEVVDVHGEIVDHESMKAVLADWPGNIREMHQAKAVGKAITVSSDDDAKATILRARISKGAPDTWEKVLDGTLSMFSIGGSGKRITTKSADGKDQKRIVMSALHEISVVDNGACPTAKFELVKSVDGVSVECQPEEPATSAEAGFTHLQVLDRDGKPIGPKMPVGTEAAKTVGTLGSSPRGALLALLAKAVAPAASDVAKSGYPECYDINAALTAIGCLESLLASEWWEARDEALSGETDDTGTAQAQLQLLRQAINLVLAFLVSEFDEQFSEFDEADAAAAATDPMAFAAGILKRGARHSKSDVTMIQAMHDSAVTLGAGCATTEKVVTVTVDGSKVAEAFVAAATLTPEQLQAKVAAEHAAKATGTPTGTVTGLPVPALNTTTATVTATPETLPLAVVPAAAEPVQQAAAAQAVDVQSIVKAAVAEATQALKATSDATIAELSARVDKLTHTPRPGGPVGKAVAQEKTLAGPSSAAADVDPAAVHAFAMDLAKDATPAERQRIAERLIRFQHGTGDGAVAFRSHTGRAPATPDPEPSAK